MFRITADEVTNAAKKCNKQIASGVTLEKHCGCPLGLLYEAETGKSDDYPFTGYKPLKWADEKYGTDFVNGFITGFDSENFDTLICTINREELKKGYENGKQLRKELLES